jgi:lysyl-tRNA synthetase class 2
MPLADVRNARLHKVAALREMGINPYPSRSVRTHFARDVLEDYGGHEGKTATVAGRLMSFRKHGALAFGHLQDQTGRIQLYLRRDRLRPTDPAAGRLGYEHLNLFDIGDVVEAAGSVTRTERGEISILADSLRILTKSLRPLPEKWAGLRDRELILRRRYLDTTIHPEHRQLFEFVSRMLLAIRRFLDARGFLEFHTPVIQPQYGGGTAKPFMTHVNALDSDMYLAISHELYLKRLILAGYDQVYTIGRYFRNEGVDRAHHPEFSMLETMTAYENYEYNMDLIEALFGHVAREVFGKTEFNVRGHEVDFGQPWERISMADAVQRATGIDFRACASVDQANAHLAALKIQERQPTVGEALALTFEEVAGPSLIAPTLVYGHPVEISPLAKPRDDDARFAERFEIFVAGMECGDNWSEQNDPAQLLEVWKRAYETARGDISELHPLDYDFIEALEYGMPPTTGIGPGIERMAMIFTGQENIDEVIFFPLMRPVISAVNRAIYGVADYPGAPADVRDLVLTLEAFEGLVRDDVLRPQTANLLIRPHLRVWNGPEGRWLATGTIEIEGFQENGLVRLAGYHAAGEGNIDREREKKAFAEFASVNVQAALRLSFPDRAVELAHVLYESDAAGRS